MKKILLISCLLLLIIYFARSGSTSDGAQLPSGIPSPFCNSGFIENRGQLPSDILFKAALPGVNVIVTQTGIVYDFYQIVNKTECNPAMKQGHVIKMTLPKKLSSKIASGENPLQGYTNYFMGNDRSKWASHVIKYSDIKINEIFSGVDAVLRLDGAKPRYDFILKPGATVKNIALSFTGQDRWKIDNERGLVFNTQLGEIVNGKIYAYQSINGVKKEIACNFKNRNGKIGFEIAGYDKSLPLVIDPLIYGSYLGGDKDDKITGIVNAEDNAVLITGWTESSGFVTTPGAYKGVYSDNRDAFVAKFKIDGATHSLEFSTFIGDLDFDEAIGVKTDADHNIYIAGNTRSKNFPTESAFLSEYCGMTDGFISKFSSDGTKLIYSTFLGGTKDDYIHGMAINDKGNIYVVGETLSANFPVGNGAFQPKKNGLSDAFCAKLNGNGTSLEFSTFLGGNTEDKGYGIDVDETGAVYITGTSNSIDFPFTPYEVRNGYYLICQPYSLILQGGYDAFVAKLKEGDVEWATFFGGTADDIGLAVKGNNDGTCFFAGVTSKEIGDSKFPIIGQPYQSKFSGGTDLFFGKLDKIISKVDVYGWTNKSQALLMSTFCGSKSNEYLTGMIWSMDKGSFYLFGSTNSSDFPIIRGDGKFSSGYDGFVLQMNEFGAEVMYSNIYGGRGNDSITAIAIDSRGDMLIAGSTTSDNLVTTQTALQPEFGGKTDGFILKQSLAKLTLATPAGGKYCQGEVLEIKWILENISEIDHFKIEYKEFQDSEWKFITDTATGISYKWKLPDDLQPLRSYTIKVSHTSGAYSIGQTPFSINQKPVLSSFLFTPENTELCEGGSFNIIASAYGDGIKFEWYFNSNKINDQNDSNLTISNVNASNAGIYKLVISGTCKGDITSNEVDLKVKLLTVITNSPVNKIVGKGKSVEFSLSATGSNLSYQWLKEGSVLIGETKRVFNIPSAQKLDEGSYKCVVTGDCGIDTSDAAILVVDEGGWVNPGDGNTENGLKINFINDNSTDYFTVRVESDRQYQARVFISDYLGRIIENVYNGQINPCSNNFKIDTHNLQAGIYWLIVECGGKSSVKKLQIIP